MSLLARVVAVLEAKGIPFALIGASALTIHGVNRLTLDMDLLVVDPVCLDVQTWLGLAAEGVSVDVRRGDLTDPLAGVVRFEAPSETSVDLVIGKFVWQREILEKSRQALFAGLEIPVLEAVELILLKLYAGGHQDAWDIQQLLTGPDRETLIAGVEQELPRLPKECSNFWRRILDLGC
ncbi:MAG TPA: nucleotidyltransferase [Thermoanaerobaculia bacterium]